MTRYEQIIAWVFAQNYRAGSVWVKFSRDELAQASNALGFARMKNLGDIATDR